MSTTWVYLKGEQGPYGSIYTVGFYDPAGKWRPDSDWPDDAQAAARVHYLNGGTSKPSVTLKVTQSQGEAP